MLALGGHPALGDGVGRGLRAGFDAQFGQDMRYILPAHCDWYWIEQMRQRYPAVKVLADTRIVDEGHIISSAGISAGIDMSLHVVSRLYGEEVAAQSARDME